MVRCSFAIMNIVRGVAGLIRRTSGFGGEYDVGSASHKFPVPSPHVKFSDIGDEAILSALWERYPSVSEKAEKHTAFHIFLKQLLVIYKNWEPLDLDNSLDAASGDESQNPDDEVIISCSTAHPADIIEILIEEVSNITAIVTESISGSSNSLVITPESFRVLKTLTIITQSMHNCKVLGYYSGIQKLIVLMKAVVVQLKTIAGALSSDETLSSSNVQKAGVLQKVLVHVVAIVCGFINLQLDIYMEKLR